MSVTGVTAGVHPLNVYVYCAVEGFVGVTPSYFGVVPVVIFAVSSTIPSSFCQTTVFSACRAFLTAAFMALDDNVAPETVSTLSTTETLAGCPTNFSFRPLRALLRKVLLYPDISAVESIDVILPSATCTFT